MPETDERSPKPGAPPDAAAPAGRRLTGWRAWLARLVLAVLAPAIVLLVAEAALRIAGYGHPTGFFTGPDEAGNLRTDDRFGWRFFPPAIARTPARCILPAEKPPGTVRIFILGSSAAMGVPDPSYALGRMVEAMLREQRPGSRFEVVNAAMTAINSHVALQVAGDCAARRPDLFIVYLGNNEVVGPYGPGTVFGHSSPSLTAIRASIGVKATRVGQLAADLVGRLGPPAPQPSKWQGMQMFLDHRMAEDDPRLEAVYGHFGENLADICRIARRAGAAVIVSTVAVNLRDCPPLASAHRPGLAAPDLARWDLLYQQGAALESQGRWQESLDRFRAAAAIDDCAADLHFRMARCLARAGRKSEAAAHYARARDLDTLRFRADSRINRVIRERAGGREAEGIFLVDAERAFADADPTGCGAPGCESFYEHVHLRPEGNYRLARLALGQIEAALPRLAESAPAGPAPSLERCAERLALTAWDRYRMALAMSALTEEAPFTNQLDHEARQASVLLDAEALRVAAFAPGMMDKAAGVYEAAIEKAPDDWMLRQNLAGLEMVRGRYDAAIALRHTILAEFPHDAKAHAEMGILLLRAGRPADAAACFAETMRLRSWIPEVHKGTGDALAMQGNHAEAVPYFQEALRLRPDYANAHRNLGVSLVALGRVEEAISHFSQAVRLDPDAHGFYDLANQLAKKGRMAEAVANYEKALQHKPDAELTEKIRKRIELCRARQAAGQP